VGSGEWAGSADGVQLQTSSSTKTGVYNFATSVFPLSLLWAMGNGLLLSARPGGWLRKLSWKEQHIIARFVWR